MKHSFTSISLFLKCPQRYKAQYVDRRVPRTSSPALERGNAIHEQLETSLKAKADAPPVWVDENLWASLRSLPVQVEQKIETDTLVAKLDVYVPMGDAALILDWKTGKSEGDPLQFDVYAAALRSKGITKVQGLFVYVDRRSVSPLIEPSPASVDAVDALVHRVENETKWHAKPGFYCTGCPLTECRYQKPVRR